MHIINELEQVFSLPVKRMLVRECSAIHLFSLRLCNWSTWSMNSSGNLEILTGMTEGTGDRGRGGDGAMASTFQRG